MADITRQRSSTPRQTNPLSLLSQLADTCSKHRATPRSPPGQVNPQTQPIA